MSAPAMAVGLRTPLRREAAAAGSGSDREEERRQREHLSNCVSEKTLSSHKGTPIGQSQDEGGGGQPPTAEHLGGPEGTVKYIGNCLVVKEEPEEATAQEWETQWQEFLSSVEASPSLPEVPHFPQEPAPWDDTPAFLASFEQVAKAYQWPEEEWADRLLPTLKGEAELAFSSLEDEEKEDYAKVKAAILRGDTLNQEKSRQCFRRFCYQQADGPRGAYNQLQEFCRQWLKAEKNSKEQILELLVLEQFLTVLPPEIQSWVKKHHLESGAQAVSLAEDFLFQQGFLLAKDEQIIESPGEGSMNLSELEESLSDAGPRPQLCRESEVEEDTDFSDTDLLADDGDEENHLQEYLEYQRIYAGERSHLCSDCGEGFWSRLSLEAHQRGHMEQTPSLALPKVTVNICGECGETFNSTLDLDAHERSHAGQKSCTCKECGESFSQMLDLRKHQRIHSGHSSFEMPGSGKYNLWVSSHKNHRDIQSGSNATPTLRKGIQTKKKTLLCPKCGDVCTCAWKLRWHLRSQSGKKSRKCTDNREHLSSSSSLNEGRRVRGENIQAPLLRNVSQRNSYKCSECEKCFFSAFTLNCHQRVHTGEKPYQCPDCPERFMWKTGFNRHREKVHKRKQSNAPLQREIVAKGKGFPCSECGQSFARAWHLKSHQRLHRGEKPYQCTDCGMGFLRGVSLARHRRKSHKGKKSVPVLEKVPSIQGKRYTCQECGESFERHWLLTTHRCARARKKPYKCAQCGIRYLWAKSLQRHSKEVHKLKGFPPLLQRAPAVQGKTHTCKKCGKSFNWTLGLVTHQCNPVAKKPHTSLERREALPQNLSGTGKKSYSCLVCGKKFIRENHIKAHQRTHTGEKPYQCSRCRERFMWRPSFYSHSKKMHKGLALLLKAAPCVQGKLQAGKQSYKCTVCGKGYKREGTFKRHMKNHSGKNANPFLYKLPGTQSTCHTCSMCGGNFSRLSQLIKHQGICAKQKPYRCAECGESFESGVSLEMHRKKNHKKTGKRPPLEKTSGDPQNKCKVCGKCFNDRSYLSKHQRIHTGSKPYRCSDCGKCFRWHLSFTRHRKIHERHKLSKLIQKLPGAEKTHTKSYKCLDCGESFMGLAALNLHQTTVHMGKKLVPLLERIPNTQYLISFKAGKSSHKQTEGRRQKPVPENSKSYACNLCEKRYSSSSSLWRHQYVHLPVKPFQCCECGQKFSLKEYLGKHMKKHNSALQ